MYAWLLVVKTKEFHIYKRRDRKNIDIIDGAIMMRVFLLLVMISYYGQFISVYDISYWSLINLIIELLFSLPDGISLSAIYLWGLLIAADLLFWN